MKLYNDCESLPVRPFFKIFETGDLRHLMSEPKKRLSVKDISLLNDTWEAIMVEYEGLTNDSTYSMSMKVTNYNMQRLNRIAGIKAALILLACDRDEGKEYLEYWGIDIGKGNVEDITRIRTRISAEMTQLRINQVQKEDKKTDTNFFKHWSELEKTLGYSKDYTNVSVAEWVQMINVAKDGGKN